jgi:hypothetical protein
VNNDRRPTSSSVLFRGEYAWRSRNGTWAVTVLLVFGAVFSSVAATALLSDAELLSRFVGCGFLLGGAIFGGFGLVAAGFWIGDKRDVVEVTEDGIRYRNRFKSWHEIRKFYGTRYRHGVYLTYLARRAFQFGDGSLPTTPLLNEAEYELLAKDLQRTIQARFPHVEVVPYPIDDTG